MEAAAQLNSFRESPRKVRLVASALRGKKVSDAKRVLSFTTKKSTDPLHKLLNSAVSNAKNIGLNSDSLFVKSITVNGGRILYRRRPVAHGAAHPIRKRTSRIKIILEELKDVKKQKSKN